jgi:hypothetical protein
MSASKSILKLTPTHCAVKVYGTGSATISLATDLIYPNGREVASTPVVNIVGIHWSIPGSTAATLKRNSVQHWTLLGAYSLLFNGFTDRDDNTSDIVVDFGGGTGTIILELLKLSGYNDTQHQNSNI